MVTILVLALNLSGLLDKLAPWSLASKEISTSIVAALYQSV
jgi:hypothetical protein